MKSDSQVICIHLNKDEEEIAIYNEILKVQELVEADGVDFSKYYPMLAILKSII